MSEFGKINDNELLYLIQEGSEEALELMFQKYDPLIKTKMKRFKIEADIAEDCLQEGRLMLLKAIKLYDASSNKTFNKYFDLILTNRLISLLRENKRKDNITYMTEEIEDANNRENKELENFDYSKLKLSDMEKEIYKMRFLRNFKVSDICQILKVSEKTVYNSIQRIKNKLDELK
ncbi:MAG: sigma-70 family RNA polymerase sigma factor [Bacilli bacterium]|nr:sigma-70 family RNA polymerase sigma factor [Bacilli bacterium]